jgi:hypothetical protein
LPSSEGWKRKKPISIQRFDPRMAEPITKTTAVSEIAET